jgi:hypothetical protein
MAIVTRATEALVDFAPLKARGIAWSGIDSCYESPPQMRWTGLVRRYIESMESRLGVGLRLPRVHDAFLERL